ncbi:hypothetical protein PEC301296_22510 [Pectobacterium carotovorum subsp. carotovorum]|nr:hypothetical protein PEC301296_22510 [Pectobacterium carotovorum subsp. carotovorum]
MTGIDVASMWSVMVLQSAKIITLVNRKNKSTYYDNRDLRQSSGTPNHRAG